MGKLCCLVVLAGTNGCEGKASSLYPITSDSNPRRVRKGSNIRSFARMSENAWANCRVCHCFWWTNFKAVNFWNGSAPPDKFHKPSLQSVGLISRNFSYTILKHSANATLKTWFLEANAQNSWESWGREGDEIRVASWGRLSSLPLMDEMWWIWDHIQKGRGLS